MRGLLVAFIVLLSVAALSDAAGIVRIDPRVVLDSAAREYRERPITEELRITAETLTEKRIERLTVRTRPGEGAELTLGPLTLWTDLRHWFAVHDDVPGVYLRKPIENGDVRGAIEEALPNVVMPQVDWMLADGAGRTRMSGLLSGTRWTEGCLERPSTPGERGSRWIAMGEADGREVRLETDGRERFDRIVIADEKAGLTVTIERVESLSPAKHELGEPLDGRRPVGSLKDLLVAVPNGG